jgi:hypothetical protein
MRSTCLQRHVEVLRLRTAEHLGGVNDLAELSFCVGPLERHRLRYLPEQGQTIVRQRLIILVELHYIDFDRILALAGISESFTLFWLSEGERKARLARPVGR